MNLDLGKMFRIWTICIVLLQICYGAPLDSQKNDKCSVCSPGFGVKTKCNGTVDTRCEPCPTGFYSNITSAKDECLVCAKCGEGLFELHPCNATHDVFCELCSWTKATKNENYKVKCVEDLTDFSVDDEDYVNTIPDHFEFLKGSFDDLMLGDQPMPDNDTQSQNTISIDSDKDLKNDTKFEPKSSSGKASKNNTTDSTSLPSDNSTNINSSSSQSVAPNVTDPVPGQNVIIIGDDDDGSGSDDLHPSSVNHVGPDDDDAGSGDLAVVIVIGGGDTDEPTEITTTKGDVSTTTRYRPPPPRTRPPTLPPLPDEEETLGPTDGLVIAPVNVPDDGANDEDEELVYVGESKDDDGLPVFAIIMAIVTTGFIFFVLGFIFNRRRSGTVTYTPSHKYKRAATKPPVENNYHEMKHMNSTTPSTPPPQITYTDEEGRNSPENPKQDLAEPNGNAPSETVPMLPNDDTFPLGNHQSPVDIDADSAEVDDTLEKHPLVAKYIPENVNTITNTGATIKVDYDSRDSTLTGGPLGSKRYCLNHIEVHWGGVDSRGSEHTLNGLGYAAEIQLVHWNHDDCINYAHALSTEDGIAILSVLVEVPIKAGQSDHSGLKFLTDCLPSIQYKSESRHLPGGEFDPKRLLPDNMCDYWTYSGSLTSAPYHQSVTWIIFKDHISISHEQLERFRRLRTFERDEDDAQQPNGGFLVDNYRYTMPLNDRKITASFL